MLSKRDNITNEISLLMDGGETKNDNLITIFTTNHFSSIDPTFLRGKRIGGVITLTALDKDTANKMFSDSLVDEFDKSIIRGSIDKACEKVEELKIVPAFIGEIIDRVKAHLIFDNERDYVEEQDILNAISSYERQMKVARIREPKPTPEELLSSSLKEVLVQSLSSDLTKLDKKVDDIYDKVC